MQAAENDEKRNQGQIQPTVDPGSGYQHGTVRKPSIFDGPVETKSEDQQILQQDATTPENSFVVLGKDGDSIMSEDGIFHTQYRKHFEASDQEHQEHKEAAAANFQQEEKSGMDPQKLSPCRERIQNNETESGLEQNPEERGRAVRQNPAVPGDRDIRSSPEGQNTQTPDTTEYEIRGSPGMISTGRRPTDGLATGSPTDANQKSPSGRTTDSPATNRTDQVGLPRMVSPRVDSGHSKDQTGIPETEYDLTPYPNYTGSRIPQYDVEYGPNRTRYYVGGKTSTPDKYQPLQTPRYQGQTISRNIGYPVSMNQQYPQQMYMYPLVNQTDSYSLDSNRGSQHESLPDIYRSGLPGKQQRDPEIFDNIKSPNTGIGNATVKISGYPESFDLNVLGMYVESEKRFGARVNSIEQRRNCILVNVPSIEDAERVCSREHNLLDCKLQLEIYSPESEQVATRLKVTGYPPTFPMDILEMYLENERGIGAKTENIEIDKADGYTYFTVSSLQDAERICEQKHEVYGCQLTVEICRPEEEKKAQEILKLVVSGYPESFDLRVLEMYLENEKRLGAKAEKVEVGKGQSFVTLSCLDDIELISKKQHKLADYVLNIEVYQPQSTIDKTARTVKVSGYSSSLNEDVLQLFFESEKKFGAKCEELKIDAAKGCSFVTLSSVEEAEAVCRKEHHLDGSQLTVEIFDPTVINEDLTSDDILVKITGYSRPLETEKIKLYLENRKKFGAELVKFEIDDDDECIYVTLSSPEDAEKVNAKNHKYKGKNLRVEKYTPPPLQHNRFLVTNINEDTSKETLFNFLQGKLDIDIKDVMYNEYGNKAVVTFKDQIAVKKLLAKSEIFKEKLLEGKELKLKGVPVSSKIKVSNLVESIDDEDLENCLGKYVTVKDVEMFPDRNYAIIDLESQQDVDNICGKKLTLSSTKLGIQVYQKCLGEDGGIENPHDFIKPENVVMEMSEDDRYKLEFIHQTNSNLNEFKCHMSKSHTVVEWDRAGLVYLVCTLTKDVKDARKLTKTWTNDSKQDLTHGLQEYQLKEFKLLKEVLDEVVKEHKELVMDKSKVIMTQGKESDSKTLVVVNKDKHQFESVTSSLQKSIQAIEELFERKNQEVTEKVKLKYTLSTFRQLGILETIQSSNQQLQMSSTSTEREIELKGTFLEITSAKAFLLEQQNDIKTTQMTSLHGDQIRLITSKECMEVLMQENPREMEGLGLWKPADARKPTLDVIAKDDQTLERTVAFLNSCSVYQEITLKPEQRDLLGKRMWQKFVETVQKQYPHVIKIYFNEGVLAVVAVTQIFDLVKESLGDFFEEYTIYTEDVIFEAPHIHFLKCYHMQRMEKEFSSVKILKFEDTIKIEGKNKGLTKMKNYLDDLNAKIMCKEKNVNTPSYCKFLQSDKGTSAASLIEREHRCIITIEDDIGIKGGNASLKTMATFQIKSAKVCVAEGDMTELKVDVIVNAANEELQHIGGLAGAILKKGGQVIQEDCNRYVKRNGRVLEGQCMISTAGTLPCQRIIHAVGSKWKGGHSGERECLYAAIIRTLEMVMTQRFTSVAIPAISTGIFGYPSDEATQIIVQAIANHFQKVPATTLKLIYLVDIQSVTLNNFVSALRKEPDFNQMDSFSLGRVQGAAAPIVKTTNQSPFKGKKKLYQPIPKPRRPVERFSSASPKPNIVMGEIAKAKADVIVNSTTNSLQLHGGALSSSINAAAGPSLQMECKERYPNGIRMGDIAVTGPGNLKCSSVFHCALSNYKPSAGEKELKKVILKCLTTAEGNGYTSIAFPAIGTGNLGFPADVVAKTFLQTIGDYCSTGGVISAQNIQIVVYPKAVPTVTAFNQSSGRSTQSDDSESDEEEDEEEKGSSDEVGDDGNDSLTAEVRVEIGNFTLTVGVGNILDAQVGVIVNSTNKDLNLSMGAVSQALLKVGKTSLQTECEKQVEKMKQNGIAMTPIRDMNYNNVIHIDAKRFQENWKGAIKKCLEMADQKKIRSIAFPALGTGSLGVQTGDFAEALFKALSTTTATYLKDVQVVIFQESMLDPFLADIKKKNKPSFIRTMYNFVTGGLKSAVKELLMTDAVVPINRSRFKEKIVFFYSDDSDSIDKAMRKLDQIQSEETQKKSINISNDLSPKDKQSIKDFGLENEVTIEFDTFTNKVVIFGLLADVSNVSDKVHEIQRATEKRVHEAENAEILKSVVQWSRVGNNGLKDYPSHINKTMEDAFQTQKSSIKFRYNNKEWNLDFSSMLASNTTTSKKIEIVRKDKIKDAGVKIPSHWLVSDKEVFKQVVLSTSDSEYQTVAANFTASGRAPIQIERIENPSLWQQYMAKKKELELDLRGNANIERSVLWHGTDETSIPNINKYGFNRSFCGKNATLYGQGVYFAVNSSYSVRYARRNNAGQCQMYQCKVLVGDYTQGNSSYRVPPNKPGGTQPYNSLVDDTASPSMFIIFHDAQAYPEYLITF